jgi:hypothetical protein
MPKFAALVRSFTMTPEFKVIMEAHVSKEEKVKPGQLRQSGDWFGLTYLKTYKHKNFNPLTWDYDNVDFDTIRAVKFRIVNNKMLVMGGRSEADQIDLYFQTLVMDKADAEGNIDYTKFFAMNKPTVDLANILTTLETDERMADVKKIKLKKVEISLGQILYCTVNTQDYGSASKTIKESTGEEQSVLGMEITIKDKAKTTLFFDVTGMIRVISKAENINVEELVMEAAEMV